jgi:hypothetical protein
MSRSASTAMPHLRQAPEAAFNLSKGEGRGVCQEESSDGGAWFKNY